MLKNCVIAVVGPTASGKTRLAVNVAKTFNGEVISSDSMQIYKELSIGTARPTSEEMDGVEHHLYGFKSIDDKYSVADYVDDANREIDSLINKGKVPVICGGTGLYADSLLSGTAFDEIKSDPSIREKYLKFANEFGNEKLHDLLLEKDPKSAEKIHYNNVVRVIRALEVFDITGKSILDHQAESHKEPFRYSVCYVGINFRNRETLYERINKRVDDMINEGIMNEALIVYNDSNAITAKQAIGYKEFFPYFEGNITLDEAISNLKKETRHYAKRQLTWFLKNNNIKWFYRDDYKDINDIYSDVNEFIENWRNDEK